MSIKGLIEESKKIRESRGHDFFSNTKPDPVKDLVETNTVKEFDYEDTRKKQIKLNNVIFEFDQEVGKKYKPEDDKPKPRKKRVHIFLKESVIEFLDNELKKSTSWKLRKNASYGDLIGAFLERFQLVRERERRQINRVKLGIDKFSELLVNFKKNSLYPDKYSETELINIRMKELSLELCNLIILYEFENDFLKSQLEEEKMRMLDFAINWRRVQNG